MTKCRRNKIKTGFAGKIRILCELCSDKEIGIADNCGRPTKIPLIHHKQCHSDIPYNDRYYPLMEDESEYENLKSCVSAVKIDDGPSTIFQMEEPTDEVLRLRTLLEAYARK